MSGLLDVKDELCQGILDMNLGDYSCKFVTNIPQLSAHKNDARGYFDLGLRYFFAYQHEDAYICFLKCIELAPNCAFAHGLIALCHCPNYNFKGAAYYESTDNPDEEEKFLADIKTNGGDITKRIYPSQQVATYHTRLAIKKVEELKKMNQQQVEESIEESSHMISEVESQILSAIQILTSHPTKVMHLPEQCNSFFY